MMSEAATHSKQLMAILQKHSSYPHPSLVSQTLLCHEWEVLESHYDDTAGQVCLCGKEDIRHVNVIRNRFNGLRLEPIGSSCIKRFDMERLNISCMCCARELGKDNVFLQAYMKYRPVTAHTLVMAHKACVRKFFKEAKRKGCYGVFLTKESRDYFQQLGVLIRLDRQLNINVEYNNPALTPYVDALCECL